MSNVAVIAGEGRLAPAVVGALKTRHVYALDGLSPEVEATPFRLERLVPFLDKLADDGVTQVVFAGAIRRPRLEPELFDPQTMMLVPRIVAAMQTGDDAALREVLAVFEESGLEVMSVDQILPELVPQEGILAGDPQPCDCADAETAANLMARVGLLDIGQGLVVAQGLCLAVETLPGTEAMLKFAGEYRDLRPNLNGAKGVIYKAPKPGQDRRIDLPTVGPDTVQQAKQAGLAGIVWQAGGIILLERERTIADAQDAGLFLWARA